MNNKQKFTGFRLALGLAFMLMLILSAGVKANHYGNAYMANLWDNMEIRGVVQLNGGNFVVDDVRGNGALFLYDNAVLACHGATISGVGKRGSGLVVRGKNVKIDNCNIKNYNIGIDVRNQYNDGKPHLDQLQIAGGKQYENNYNVWLKDASNFWIHNTENYRAYVGLKVEQKYLPLVMGAFNLDASNPYSNKIYLNKQNIQTSGNVQLALK